MRLGIQLGYSGEGFAAAVDEVAEFEAAGAELVVVPEAYSFDAVSSSATSPARTTPDAARLRGDAALHPHADADRDDRGRARLRLRRAFSLGLGASGPQVIEGFHGSRTTRRWRVPGSVEICRRVWRREVLIHRGPALPDAAAGASASR
jgi:hypothetical protein